MALVADRRGDGQTGSQAFTQVSAKKTGLLPVKVRGTSVTIQYFLP